MDHNPRTVVASVPVPGRRFVNRAGGLGGADVIGVSENDAVPGKPCSVITLGNAVVEAAVDLAAGAVVDTDADGRAVPASGIGLGVTERAAGAGGRVDVRLHGLPGVALQRVVSASFNHLTGESLFSAGGLRVGVSSAPFFASGDGVTDSLAAIHAALAVAEWVEVGPSASGAQYLLSGEVVIPAGKTLHVMPGVVLRLADSSSATCVIAMGGDEAQLLCDGVLDGNLSGRQDALGVTAVWGVRIENVSHCNVRVNAVSDVGATDAGIALNYQNGGGVIINMTSAASADVSHNIVQIDRIINSQKHGFMARIRSDFAARAEGWSPYFCQYNTIKGIRGNGGNKNAVEILGPHTRFNTVSDVVAEDSTGQSGFECDFGAYGNIFEKCVEQFSSGFVFGRAHSALTNASNLDVAEGGTQKVTRDNTWIDCGVVGGIIDDRSLNICAVLMGGTGVKFIRPFARGQTLSGTAFINGAFIESVVLKSGGIECLDPVFQSVRFGVRLFGNQGHGHIGLNSGRIVYSEKALSVSSECIVDRVVFDGVTMEGGTAAIRCTNPSYIERIYSLVVKNCLFLGQTETTITPQGDARYVTEYGGNFFACASTSGVPIQAVNKGALLIDAGGNIYTARVPGGAINGNTTRVINSSRNHVTNIALASSAIGRAVVVSTAAPTVGTYAAGDRWEHPSPAAGGVPGGVCVASGTADSISVAATSTAGSKVVVVTDASTLAVGQYVQLSGAFGVARITDIDGLNVTVSATASGSVSGTMTNRAFTFKNFAAVAA